MPITLTRIDPAGDDREELIQFMTTTSFPFHMRRSQTRETVEEAIEDGAYRDEDNDSYWIDHSEFGRVGFFRFEDLSELAPLFDLRLGDEWRGRGIAREVLTAATDHAFSTMPEVTRFEGQTRDDNLAMRRTFTRCGWTKEAHYREAWPVEGRTPAASVAYAILRREWENLTGRASDSVAGIDGIVIRPARSSDTEDLVSLWTATDLVRPWNDPHKDVERALSVQPELFYVAVTDDDKLVGSIMAGYNGHRGWMNYLAVEPASAGQGLGRALVERVESTLTDLGCPKVNLQVRTSNTEVLSFYEHLGYTPDDAVSLGKRLISDEG